MKKNALFVLFVVFTILVGCGQATEKKLTSDPYKETNFLMGTIVTVKVYDEGKEDVLKPVFDSIHTLSNQISLEESESEVEKININAGLQPVEVTEDIYRLIDAGKIYSEKSSGSFDLSIGPLTGLWRIGFDDAKKPKQDEIDAVLPLINYSDVELNAEEQTVFLKKKGMQLDLGAIAKGFIADEVVTILKEHDITTAIIDLGGNIYVMGDNPSGDKWTVGIQNPFAPRGETIGKVSEANKSIVTSGIYERFLEIDDTKYHHLLNPKDGYPFMNDIAGVSIISNKSIDGDALSTSVFAKGIKDGMQYIEGFDEVEAIFISTDKKIYISSGLKGVFELTNEDFELGNF
ncbi:FAD:protein FMN transferase [Aquibacillus saliphilus]|uniref:FAD:protein FMN transferase n=1 Tax=Aquibacillus saliphilus TaxID=1909422 RepID=UPI002714DA60|nr:FAD:protein FMN transferase [Aquibacillus saliphilus]